MMNLYDSKKYYIYFLLIIFSEYLISYYFLGEIIIRDINDFLDSNYLNNKIISEYLFLKSDNTGNILGGVLQLNDYPNLLYYYQHILYFLLGDKFWFIFIVINSYLAFCTFNLLAKKKFPGLPRSIYFLSSGIYSCLIYDQGMNFQWGLLPYFIYLIFCKENYSIKHYFIVFLTGSMSSLYYASFIYLYSIIFIIIFYKKKFEIKFFKLYLCFLIGAILISSPTLYNLIKNGASFYHRSFFVEDFNLVIFLKNKIKDLLYLNLHFSEKTLIFYIPQILLIWILYIYSLINFNNKKIKIYILNILFCIIFFDLIFNLKSTQDLIKFLNLNIINIVGKLVFFKYFLISFLFLYLYKILSFGHKKFLVFLSILFLITYPVQTSGYLIIRHYINNNFNKNTITQLKNDFYKKEYYKIFKILISSKDLNVEKKSIRHLTSQTFEGFYRTSEMKYIKEKYIKNQRVMALGIHPATLAFNNIKVLGGYFNLYPVHYKNSFLKIIENLDKDYVDNFKKYGSIVSINEEFNNLDEEYVSKVKYEEAYKLGAKYVITKYKLKNNNLAKICLNCTDKFLKQYKINIYKIQN